MASGLHPRRPELRYKGRSAESREARALILAGVRERERLDVSADDARQIEEDTQGDALDAVLCALAARAALQAGFPVLAGGAGDGGSICSV